MSEQRRFVRRQARGYFHAFDRNSNKMIGRIVDMSTRGVRIITEKPIEVPGTIPCKMDLPEEVLDGGQLNFDADSKWCRKNDRIDCYETGLQIHGVTEQDEDAIKLLLHLWMAEASDSLNPQKDDASPKLKIRY